MPIEANRGGDREAYRGSDREAYRGSDREASVNTLWISTDKKTLNELYTYKQPMEDAYRGGDREAYRGSDREAYRGSLLSQFELALTKRH